MPAFRRIARRVLRLLARPVLAPVDARLKPIRDEVRAHTEQLSALLARIASIETVVHELRHGQILFEENAHREQHRREGEVSALRERWEFTRQELMYEMRYGARGPGGTEEAPIEPRILAPERLTGATDLRINLGCGHIPLPDFVNVDSRELEHIDVLADVRRLPFPTGSLAQVHSAHLLEHFPLEEVRRSLLPYWFSLLRPGGLLSAVVPDTEAMIAEFSAGRLSFEELRLVTFGQQEYDGDFHFNMFSRSSICDLLREAGLEDVRILESGRRNGVCYEMELQGRRPAAPPAEPADA